MENKFTDIWLNWHDRSKQFYILTQLEEPYKRIVLALLMWVKIVKRAQIPNFMGYRLPYNNIVLDGSRYIMNLIQTNP